jgi:hypothetical protein
MSYMSSLLAPTHTSDIIDGRRKTMKEHTHLSFYFSLSLVLYFFFQICKYKSCSLLFYDCVKKKSIFFFFFLVLNKINLLIIKHHAESNKNNKTGIFFKCVYKNYYLFIKFQSLIMTIELEIFYPSMRTYQSMVLDLPNLNDKCDPFIHSGKRSIVLIMIRCLNL